MDTPARSDRTRLGLHIEQRMADLGYHTQVAFIEHARNVNGGDSFGRGSLRNWLSQRDVQITTRLLRQLARSLAADSSQAAYQSELNTLNAILNRPSDVGEQELDVDPDLIRQLGPAGRKYIENQIQAVVRLRREIWAERDAGPDQDDD